MTRHEELHAFGPLAAVLEAEARRGNRARLTVGQNIVRGLPPAAQLSHQLDRSAIEEEFDLGPFLAWWPSGRHVWWLVDTVSRASVQGGTPSPFAWLGRRLTRPRARRRLGYLDDYEDLRSATWQALSSAGRTVEPAEVVAGRVLEVTGSLPDALGARGAQALPAWFRAASAPDEPDWRTFFRSLRSLPPQEQHRERWAARWSTREWLRCATPDQVTWRDLAVEPVGERLLAISGERRGPGAPLASVKWLLLAAGVVECGPRELLSR